MMNGVKRILNNIVSLPLAVQVKRKARKPFGDSLKMAKAMRFRQVSIPYCEKQELFNMCTIDFCSYMRKNKPRSYVQAIARHENKTEYDVFKQMMHAKTEYGISFASFSRYGLYGASEEKLKKSKSRLDKKGNEAISRISKACSISEDEAINLVARIKEKFGLGPVSIYKHHLYDASDTEIEKFLDGREKAKSQKFELAMNETGWTKGQLEAHMAKCLSDYHILSDYYFSLRCYNLSDEQLERVLTHDDIYKLCSYFNKNIGRVDSKKEFNRNFKDYIGRRFWINRNSSFDDFVAFADGLSEVFVKPVDGMHGVGAYKLDIEDADLRRIHDNLSKDKELVVEEVVAQHPEMAAFNPTSVNTIRLYTICDSEGNVDFVNAYARFGNGGVVDNYSSGGLECGIDPKTGIINTNALCKNGEEFESHPLTGLSFKGFQIPLWDDVLDRTQAALLSIDGIDFVGWDVAIGPDRCVLIEGNCKPGPGAYQRFSLEQGKSIREPFEKYLEMIQREKKTEGKR